MPRTKEGLMNRIDTKKKKKENFDFADTIRCISMIGIVFEHCIVIADFNYSSIYTSFLQASVMQFFKFSTIAFFLIAGFLINHKFLEYTPWQYLKNRIKNTFWPWVCWVNIFVLITIGNMLYKYYRHGTSEMTDNFLAYISHEYYITMFFTSYWFILNFLICISILLVFKKYLYKVWFGVILGLVSLFYSVNLYYDWIITSHTVALFGFVFYLWLGVCMNKYYRQILEFIKRRSIWWFIGLTAVLFLFATLETLHLGVLGVADAYNTLRISNILYSLSFFLLLLKIGPIVSLNKYFDPRKHTYGIYLLHPIILYQVLVEIFRPLKITIDTLSFAEAVGYSVVRFLVVYGLSFVIVRLLRYTRLKWSIGVSRQSVGVVAPAKFANL